MDVSKGAGTAKRTQDAGRPPHRPGGQPLVTNPGVPPAVSRPATRSMPVARTARETVPFWLPAAMAFGSVAWIVTLLAVLRDDVRAAFAGSAKDWAPLIVDTLAPPGFAWIVFGALWRRSRPDSARGEAAQPAAETLRKAQAMMDALQRQSAALSQTAEQVVAGMAELRTGLDEHKRAIGAITGDAERRFERVAGDLAEQTATLRRLADTLRAERGSRRHGPESPAASPPAASLGAPIFQADDAAADGGVDANPVADALRSVAQQVERALQGLADAPGDAPPDAKSGSRGTVVDFAGAAARATAERASAASRASEPTPQDFLAAARRIIEDLHAAAIDLNGGSEADPADWQRYRGGDRAVFTRRFLADGTPPAKFGGRISGSLRLQRCVEAYIDRFESLCTQAVPCDDGGNLVGLLLNSEVGNVYAYLCRALGRTPIGASWQGAHQ